MRLIRILYQSQSNLTRDRQELLIEELLVRTRANNKRDGVTGLLVADDMWFVQVLEGAQKVVWQTFERIKKDQRHRSVLLLDARDVEKRDFADWSMSLVTRTDETSPIFARHGAPNLFNPPKMKGEPLLSLMRDLSASSFQAPFATMTASAQS